MDPHSFDTILKEAIVRSELRARLLLTISESDEDASLDHDDNDNDDGEYSVSYDIWHLPATSDKVRDWFHYHSTQALVSIELPPNLLGFIYYLVISQGGIGHGRGIGCECHSAVQNSAEGFESDEQEETKDSRCLLEELLHIGFGGDMMNEEMKMATNEACVWYDTIIRH